MFVVTTRPAPDLVSAICRVLGDVRLPRTKSAKVVESSQAKYPTGLIAGRRTVGGDPSLGQRHSRWVQSRSTRTTVMAFPSGVRAAESSLSGVLVMAELIASPKSIARMSFWPPDWAV